MSGSPDAPGARTRASDGARRTLQRPRAYLALLAAAALIGAAALARALQAAPS